MILARETHLAERLCEGQVGRIHPQVSVLVSQLRDRLLGGVRRGELLRLRLPYPLRYWQLVFHDPRHRAWSAVVCLDHAVVVSTVTVTR